jgi:hypothetical protein
MVVFVCPAFVYSDLFEARTPVNGFLPVPLSPGERGIAE